MNTPQKVILCSDESNSSIDPLTSINDYSLPRCIKMSTVQYSLATSVFNLGGLMGSLMASRIADNKGRRWTLLANCVFLSIGPIVMGFAKSYGELVFGRTLVGIGSGVVSIYLLD